jgi:hypothetical protein
MKRGPALLFGALVTSWSWTALADLQWNASLVTGVCGTGTRPELWQDTCWFNGLRGDLLFARNRDADPAFGPFVDLTTAGFDDLRLGGGGTALFPVHPYFPVVVSAGGYARHSEAGWDPGLAGWLFWGTRGYNFHSSYSLAGGLLAGLHYDVGSSRETAIVIALQIDGQILLLPFIVGYELLRGSHYD